jgi:hypothetical protein
MGEYYCIKKIFILPVIIFSYAFKTEILFYDAPPGQKAV